jgi:DNA helicase-2/ATP-dependent DNA helicase PcrA
MPTPTATQLEIRDHEDLDLLVVAPAGCGKTEALALRVQGLLNRGLIPPNRRILVTTFSNRARDNIRERLSTYLSGSQLRDRLNVTNFHGLASRLFRAHASVIGLDPQMTLPENDWVNEQCQARRLAFNETAAVQQILQRVKLQAIDDEEVARQLLEIGNQNAIEIEALRREQGRLTYDDLLRLAELILGNDAVAKLYQEHFGAVVVDEFQDLTPQQLRLVNRIGYQRTTYAGDLAQGIYGFTGARPAEINAAIRDETGTQITFAESHRSSPAVLAMVNTLIPLTGGETLTCAATETWPSGGLKGVVQFHSADDEAIWVTTVTKEILRRAPNQRVGIIARSGGRRRFVDAAVTNEADIPSYRWDDGVMDTDTARLMRQLLSRIDARSLSNTDNQMDFLRDAIEFESISDPSTRQAVADALGWCLDLFQEGVPLASIRRRIRVGDNATLLTAPGAHLLTGHVGKGQQFDWVFVIGAEEGTIPDFRSQGNDEQIAEEARVLSVMISRARHGVVVSHASQVMAQTGRTMGKQPSRFLSSLATASPLNRTEIVNWIRESYWAEIVVR